MRYDVVVIGSGFGGSVTALRLTEKGYSVGGAGGRPALRRRRVPEDLLAAARASSGPRRLRLLRHPADHPARPRSKAGGGCWCSSGAGVGGGSLVYANTLYEPLRRRSTPTRSGGTSPTGGPSWRRYYDQAKRMLGVTTYPTHDPRGRGDAGGRRADGRRRHLPPDPGRACFFGRPGERVADPYFGGAGPERTGCTALRRVHDRLPARREEHPGQELPVPGRAAGAVVHPLTTVTAVRPRPTAAATRSRPRAPAPGCAGAAGRSTPTRWSSRPGRSAPSGCCTRCGPTGALPRCRDRLGELTRTNSEAILGARCRSRARADGLDFTDGVAITSSFHPDEHTHIEPVRYGKGSNAMGLLQTC